MPGSSTPQKSSNTSGELSALCQGTKIFNGSTEHLPGSKEVGFTAACAATTDSTGWGGPSRPQTQSVKLVFKSWQPADMNDTKTFEQFNRMGDEPKW